MEKSSAPTSPARQKKPSLLVRVRALAAMVWDSDPFDLTPWRRFYIRCLRVIHLVVRGFKQDECILHASSLTFTSLLAIVPFLALSLSLVRTFGGADLARTRIKEFAREWFSSQTAPETAAVAVTVPQSDIQAAAGNAPDDNGTVPDTATPAQPPAEDASPLNLRKIESLVDTAFDRINHLDFAALGGIGVFLLLWVVISTVGQVEAAFNRVWGVKEQRTLFRKFTDYLGVIIVVPLLFVAASSFPIASIKAQIIGDGAGSFLSRFGAGHSLVRAMPILAIMTLSFMFMLRFLPNTRVRNKPALAGGFCTAVAILVWLKLCTALQIGVARNSVFFGSFAAVPILLFWVFITWEIIMFGAEITFAVQNADTYRMEQGAQSASLRARLLVAVDILAAGARSLRNGDGLLDLVAYQHGHHVSVRLVNNVARELVECGYLAEVADRNSVFVLRKDVGALTVADVFRTLLDTGRTPAELGVGTTGELAATLNDKLNSLLPQRIADL